MLTDGPFAETKEQIGGFYMIDCKNLDEAIDWAAKIPSARAEAHRDPAGHGLRGAGAEDPQRSAEARLVDGSRRGRRRLFRQESGRAVATLIRILGDFDLAEEAVQEAFVIALERWPRDGLPHNPGAWIVAHRAQPARSTACAASAATRRSCASWSGWCRDEPDDADRHDPCPTTGCGCSSPAATRRSRPEARVALTLRTLGGLSTPEVARAFLTGETAMQQRLVRAKRKIRDGAASPTRCRPDHELPDRLRSVLASLYLIFNEGYLATSADTAGPARAVRRGDPARPACSSS